MFRPSRKMTRRSRSTTSKPKLRAMDAAVNALRARDYFEGELQSLLAGKGYPEDEVDSTLASLKRWGFLDDGRVGELVLDSARRRKEGPLAVRHKLESRGAPAEVVDQILEWFDADSPLDRALGLLHEKKPKNRAAAGRLLWRKGYVEETIESALEAWEPTADE